MVLNKTEKSKVYRVNEIVNLLFKRAKAKSITDITPMKLQKLLYFFNGWHVVLTGQERLFGDNFEAWEFGLVCSPVYHEYITYRHKAIPEYEIMGKIGEIAREPEVVALADSILKQYGKYSGEKLSAMARLSKIDENGVEINPWIITRGKANNSYYGRDIDSNDIKKYFDKLKIDRVLW